MIMKYLLILMMFPLYSLSEFDELSISNLDSNKSETEELATNEVEGTEELATNEVEGIESDELYRNKLSLIENSLSQSKRMGLFLALQYADICSHWILGYDIGLLESKNTKLRDSIEYHTWVKQNQETNKQIIHFLKIKDDNWEQSSHYAKKLFIIDCGFKQYLHNKILKKFNIDKLRLKKRIKTLKQKNKL